MSPVALQPAVAPSRQVPACPAAARPPEPRAACSDGPSGTPVERELAGILQAAGVEGVALDRLGQLLPGLLRLALVLDTVAWGVWKQRLAPAGGSAIRQQAPLQRLVREFVSGPAGDDRPVREEIDRLRELARALVSSIGQCGPEAACRIVRGLSPEDIEAEVCGSGLRARDAECWRAYKARAAQVNGAAIEREVTGSVARFVDKWMRNVPAKARTS